MLLALDISTSCIGYSVFNEKNVLIEMNFVKFNSKRSLFEKLDDFKSKIAHLLVMDITNIAIEEPLKKFEGKFSSAEVLSLLSFFNGLISSFVYMHFKVEPVYYNVRNARTRAFPDVKLKRDGASEKHQIWELVVDAEPQINWKYGVISRKLIQENYDMADSYVIGKCFIKTTEDQKKNVNKC